VASWIAVILIAAGATPPARAQGDEPPRRAEIRAQARQLLAVRLKADVGLTDAQVGSVMPRIEEIEESRRQARRERLRLLAGLRRDVNAGASDAALQGALDALDRNERAQEERTRAALGRIDAELTVPQRVRLRFLLARLRGELVRELERIREGPRAPR
jgi:hypothetical protein